MYSINNIEELTPEVVQRFITTFSTTEKPRLDKWYRYYIGDQDIIYKTVVDESQPNNRIITNFCKEIADSYNGYITGNQISYNSDANIEPITKVLDYNDSHSEDTNLLRDALIFGVGYETMWIDKWGNQRFKKLDPRQTIPVYDNTIDGELLAVIRFYTVYQPDGAYRKFVEIYDDKTVRTYHADGPLELIEERPHFYNQVPVIVFELNEEHRSIYDNIMSLQDAYNNILSCSGDTIEQFADCYLILKNCIADAEDLQAMKKNRVLLLDQDADAEYLTKNINNTNIDDMLTRISDSIYSKSKCPNFMDERFMSASGIAMRYKLSGFIFVCSNIMANMRKALQKRIELITEIMKLTFTDVIWRDIDITFTPNLPVDMAEIINEVNGLRGMVSQKTLLAQIPFVKDVDEEMKRVDEEREASLYDFELFDEEA